MDNPDLYQKNDSRFLTPFLLMAVILMAGILIYGFTANAFAASLAAG